MKLLLYVLVIWLGGFQWWLWKRGGTAALPPLFPVLYIIVVAGAIITNCGLP